MELNSAEVIMFSLIKEAVESRGCHLTDIDFDNFLVKVDGPDEIIGACSQAVSRILA